MTDDQQPKKRPLQEVAESAGGFTTYLSDLNSAQLTNKKTLETLLHEVREHCRNVHVEGDGKFHAKRRARPVEKALTKAIRDLERASQNLEQAAYERRAHDDKLKEVAQARKDKAIAKAHKKNPAALNSPTPNTYIPNTQPVSNSAQTEYSDVTSLADIKTWRSAS